MGAASSATRRSNPDLGEYLGEYLGGISARLPVDRLMPSIRAVAPAYGAPTLRVLTGLAAMILGVLLLPPEHLCRALAKSRLIARLLRVKDRVQDRFGLGCGFRAVLVRARALVMAARALLMAARARGLPSTY